MPYNPAEATAKIEVTGVPLPWWIWVVAAVGGSAALLLIIGVFAEQESRIRMAR